MPIAPVAGLPTQVPKMNDRAWRSLGTTGQHPERPD